MEGSFLGACVRAAIRTHAAAAEARVLLLSRGGDTGSSASPSDPGAEAP